MSDPGRRKRGTHDRAAHRQGAVPRADNGNQMSNGLVLSIHERSSRTCGDNAFDGQYRNHQDDQEWPDLLRALLCDQTSSRLRRTVS